MCLISSGCLFFFWGGGGGLGEIGGIYLKLLGV